MASRGRRSAQDFQRWSESIGFTYEPENASWGEFVAHLLERPIGPVPAVTGWSEGHQLAFVRVPGQGRQGAGEQVVAAMTMTFPLPNVTLRPRGGAGAPDDPFALRTGFPAMDETYTVSAADPIVVSAMLRPPVTDRLLALPGAPVPLAARGYWLVTWREGAFDRTVAAPMVDVLGWMGQEFGRALAAPR